MDQRLQAYQHGWVRLQGDHKSSYKQAKKVMGDLVGETQTAFVQGRQILDGALIACEVVQWLKNKRKSIV